MNAPHSPPPTQRRSRTERAAQEARIEALETLATIRAEKARRERERAEQARVEGEARRREALRTATLMDFVPLASPHLVAPRHLAPLVRVFDRIAAGERVRVLVSVPAQHGKTFLVNHAIAYLLARRPTWPVVYVTYAQDQADTQSLATQRVALACNAITGNDRQTYRQWATPHGGGAMFTGVGGPLTGNPARVLIGDDLVKNRIEADSTLTQSRIADWLTSVAFTRIPEDGSAVMVGTRWNVHDPIGQLEAGAIGAGDWEVVNLPFLAHVDAEGRRIPDDHGDSVLWPREPLPDGTLVGWTVEGARQRLVEVGPYDAASIYQGQPRARGGTVYAQPVRCERPLIEGARFVIGCDAAGTDGPNSNYTVLCALAVRDVVDDITRAKTAHADVAGVLRLRLRPEHAAPQVLAWQRSFGGTPLHIEATRDGKDLGRALQAIAPGITIVYVIASGDKYLRAQPPASAWNAGRIRAPSDAQTMRNTTDADLGAFVRVVTNFTGMGGEDDDADALAHAWNAALTLKPAMSPEAMRPTVVRNPIVAGWG